MKVILQQDIKGQGKKGQLKEVSDGYARNYLLPRNLAVEATADNLNAMRLRDKARQAQIARERAQAMEYAEKMGAVVVHVKAKAGAGGKLFGAVTSSQIAEALNAQHGIAIEKNQIKQFGTFQVKCKLGYEITGTIHVMVTEEK